MGLTFKNIVRPIGNEGQRIPVSGLRNHRLTHQFTGPGCLCPLADPTQPAFVESAIFKVGTENEHGEEYMAKCAQDKCGYSGKACFYVQR
jgi:hypothetical protein